MITQQRRVLSNLIRRIETLLPGPGLALILNDLNYSAKASRLVLQKCLWWKRPHVPPFVTTKEIMVNQVG